MEEMLINDISDKCIVSKIYSNPNTWNFFSILFIFQKKQGEKDLSMNFVLFLDNCQPVSNTWTLHPFKYLYLDNYNILEGEEYAYFDKTY